jgi:hypothetical protein
VAEQREHLGGFGGIRADMAADELIGMGQKILCQRHPAKIKAVRKKSSWNYPQKRGIRLSANTTGLVGKKKRPQLMVFSTVFFADKHCE